MDYNKYSFYRANPYANNDYVPLNSMVNRKKKDFFSEIPQGLQYYSSKTGKKIFKDKITSDQIDKEHILQSPERYPFQNRIALDKRYRRNLDTIDIQGASSGTKVSESIRNKHKALEELKRKNASINSSIQKSLDQVYEEKRKQLAKRFQQGLEMKKTHNTHLDKKSQENSKQQHFNNSQSKTNLVSQNKTNTLQDERLNKQYERYVSLNSNQKYSGPPAIQNPQIQNFNRFKRRYQSLEVGSKQRENTIQQSKIKQMPILHQSQRVSQEEESKESNFLRGSRINVNNRYRSNPQYVQNYGRFQKEKFQSMEKDRQMQKQIQKLYSDRQQLRRLNPTNLSFNMTARNSLGLIH